MTESIDGYYLAAYCINAISRQTAEVEWIIVFKSIDGDWVDRNGSVIQPFHTIPITEPTPAIPDGWIEYLHAEAIKHATDNTPAKIDLAKALGIKPKAPPKIERRL